MGRALSCHSGQTTGVFLEEVGGHRVEGWVQQVVAHRHGQYLREIGGHYGSETVFCSTKTSSKPPFSLLIHSKGECALLLSGGKHM